MKKETIITYLSSADDKIKFKLFTKENQFPVYRYMNRKYIEEFLKSGKLCIPSFEKCRNHNLITRRDQEDGQYIEECDMDNSGKIKLTDGTIHYISSNNIKKNNHVFAVDIK